MASAHNFPEVQSRQKRESQTINNHACQADFKCGGEVQQHHHREELVISMCPCTEIKLARHNGVI